MMLVLSFWVEVREAEGGAERSSHCAEEKVEECVEFENLIFSVASVDAIGVRAFQNLRMENTASVLSDVHYLHM